MHLIAQKHKGAVCKDTGYPCQKQQQRKIPGVPSTHLTAFQLFPGHPSWQPHPQALKIPSADKLASTSGQSRQQITTAQFSQYLTRDQLKGARPVFKGLQQLSRSGMKAEPTWVLWTVAHEGREKGGLHPEGAGHERLDML